MTAAEKTRRGSRSSAAGQRRLLNESCYVSIRVAGVTRESERRFVSKFLESKGRCVLLLSLLCGFRVLPVNYSRLIMCLPFGSRRFAGQHLFVRYSLATTKIARGRLARKKLQQANIDCSESSVDAHMCFFMFYH